MNDHEHRTTNDPEHRTTTRPARTIHNARFGDVRADEVRVRDIIRMLDWNDNLFEVTVTSVKWVGDDIRFEGFSIMVEGTWTDRREWRWETSEGNGVAVIGHLS
jgi:hypothetical protein